MIQAMVSPAIVTPANVTPAILTEGTVTAGSLKGAQTRGRDRGGVAVELVLLVPALILVLAAMVAGWRIWSARANVQHAADAAARAASLQSSSERARERAQQVGTVQLQTVPCQQRQISVDVTDFARAGQIVAQSPGRVRVEVGCRIELSDLLLPGMPGSIDARATAASPLDRFKERKP